MKTVGIIVEYNPLHYGHLYHFEQSKKAARADGVIAVMSGHFLQRGEPALADKWARAEMALRMGVDVVIELPVAYSSQPAEWFAYGAAALLDATGVVDSLCFGSESGDIRWLADAASRISRESEQFRALIRQHLKSGTNYPAAYTAAASQYLGSGAGEALHQPNNTLGLHYLIALDRLGSRIEPLTITRQKAGYNQTSVTDCRIASATAIRQLLLENGDLSAVEPLLPPFTLDVLKREWQAGRAPLSWVSFMPQLLYRLAASTPDELAAIAEVTEGLEYRIKRALSDVPAMNRDSFDRLLDELKTKRYTRTKLQRTLLRILLGHKKEALSPERLANGPSYIRVLGFSAKGRQLLKTMRKTARLPVVSKVTRISTPYLDMDIRATSVYSLGFRAPTGEALMRDYYEQPIQREPDDSDLGGSEAR